VLKFLAPVIASAIARRSPEAQPLQVMACENAINATDLLRQSVEDAYAAGRRAGGHRAVFANTAVDRIVPNQAPGQGLDVTWRPSSSGSSTAPVSGGSPRSRGHLRGRPRALHRAQAVHGQHRARRLRLFGYAAGVEKISDAMADPEVARRVRAVLDETKQLLVTKHGFAADEQEPTCRRSSAGSPTRTSRHGGAGRTGAAAEARTPRTLRRARRRLAEGRHHPAALLRRWRLRWPSRIRQIRKLRNSPASSEATRGGGVTRITGLDAGHVLFPAVLDLVKARAAV
jgi:mannitol-1-phosphate 5-dehydrogenase